MARDYGVVLQIDSAGGSRFLQVEANDEQQAAEVACQYWLHSGISMKPWAAIEVHRFDPDGNIDPEAVFGLDRQILAQKQEEGAHRRTELATWREILEENRRRAVALAERHLAEGSVIAARLDRVKSDFERGHQEHPGLEALASLDSPPLLRGPGTLLFREIARRASQGSWERWLPVLLGYLLENDERGEYLSKVRTSSRGADEKERISEVYRIKKLFAVSALCCVWLETKLAGKNIATKNNLRPDHSDVPGKTSGPEQEAIALGRAGSKPVRRSRKYQVLDDALREIAKAQPKSHAEVFRALDGRASLPNAEPFQGARGWFAGFRSCRPAASSWLSKNWSRLNLPPFPRGPKSRMSQETGSRGPAYAEGTQSKG